jgi:hypothetical protein
MLCMMRSYLLLLLLFLPVVHATDPDDGKDMYTIVAEKGYIIERYVLA